MFSNFTLPNTFKNQFMLRYLVVFILLSTPLSLFAHQFHVALAKAEYNAKEQTLEVTMEVESHDIEHWLEDKGIAVGHIEMVEKNSDKWTKITEEILKNFTVKTDGKSHTLTVVGWEIARDGRLFIYLYEENIAPFKEIEWKISVLMDHDETQQNKLELTVNKKKYYAVFLNEKRTALIKLD